MTGLLAGIFTADPSGMQGTGGGEQLDPHLHLWGLAKLFMPNISLLTLGGSNCGVTGGRQSWVWLLSYLAVKSSESCQQS